MQNFEELNNIVTTLKLFTHYTLGYSVRILIDVTHVYRFTSEIFQKTFCPLWKLKKALNIDIVMFPLFLHEISRV
jgi:hypothetical protein